MNRACFEWRRPPAPPPSRLDQLTLGMMRLVYVIYGALLAGMVAIAIVIAHMRWREEWWLAPLLALLLIWGLMVWRCMRQSADERLLAVTGPPAFIWLLCEPQNSDRGACLFRLRFRAWQCLLALTTGGMLALCGWAALILLTSWLAAMQPVTVTIAVQPASGLRQLQAAVPGGPLKLWEESASALPCAAGQAFLLPMQRGPAGLWWQFRRQELRQRMQALPCRETAPASAPAAAYPIATLAAARDWR